ncbi:MAG: hypothetical protein ACXW05_20495 [Gemmatirosa sp.]
MTPRVRPAKPSLPTVEALLRALGADPAFVEAVLGDLAEECAERAARDGVRAARWWYVREAVRSAPHLVRSWRRHAGRHQRARVAACVALGVVASSVAVLALLAGAAVTVAHPGRGSADAVATVAIEPENLP